MTDASCSRSGRLIFDVTYGIVVESVDDPICKVAGDVIEVVSFALSPPMLVLNAAAISETFYSSMYAPSR